MLVLNLGGLASRLFPGAIGLSILGVNMAKLEETVVLYRKAEAPLSLVDFIVVTDSFWGLRAMVQLPGPMIPDHAMRTATTATRTAAERVPGPTGEKGSTTSEARLTPLVV